MTGFDFIILAIVAVAAVGGFLRGFLQEVLSLVSWVLVIFAIYSLHQPLTEALQSQLGYTYTTSILAFALLLLIPYAAMKVIANNVGNVSKNSIVGPIDRVLGFGFGGLKGIVIAIIGFSLLVLGYDNVWNYRGRPAWITTAYFYDFVDTGSRAMVPELAARRAAVLKAEQQTTDEATKSPK